MGTGAGPGPRAREGFLGEMILENGGGQQVLRQEVSGRGVFGAGSVSVIVSTQRLEGLSGPKAS